MKSKLGDFRNSGIWVLLSIVCLTTICVARWGQVLLLHDTFATGSFPADYGWEYDVGARVVSGEVQYRDFATTMAPLSG